MTLQREVKPAGKTGYDIRTDILSMAKDLAISDFNARFREYELYLMLEEQGRFPNPPDRPAFPSIEKVIEISNSMNDFVAKK